MEVNMSQLMGGGRLILHLLFYRIPKNASTSLFDHLGDINLIKKHDKKFIEIADKKIYRGLFTPTHAKPDEVYQVFRRDMANYFSFCIVRNPWDRIISMYHFAIKHKLGNLYGLNNDLTFDQFCNLLLERKDDPYFIATHKQTQWMEGFFPPKEVLRFETLKEDFGAMLKNYNISHISPDIPHKNKTDHKSYQEYYNDKTKKIIQQVFEKDIDTLKYTF